MLKKGLLLMVVGVLFFVSSCSDLTTPTGSVKLENNTTQNVVTAFYLSTNFDWGANQLSSNLGTNESITLTNVSVGDYSFKACVSNTFYYEVEMKTSGTDTNVLTSYNTSTGTVSALQTTTVTLLPAWLTVSNNSTQRLDYLYLNEVGTFDLLNMVQTNISTGDIIAAGSAVTFGEEFVAGTYTVIAISSDNITNTYSGVSLSANTTNVLNITNFSTN